MSVSESGPVSHDLAQAQFQPPQVPQDDDQHPVQATTYGTFWVNGSEFALPVGTIREIVNEPGSITNVPLSPPFLKGLFNIRGMTLPIVDLHELFEFPRTDSSKILEDKPKVAILESGDKCVGVLFDRAGEVLNNPVWAGVNLRKTSSASKGGVIDGVLSLENGSRRVLTIDPNALLCLEEVPHARVANSELNQGGRLDRRRSCVSFELGHSKCALDLLHVHEVREMPPMDRSWLVGGFTIGTVTLRGAHIPVVDFRSYMGGEPVFTASDEVMSQRKLILIKNNSGLLGLMVYSIDSIIQFFENDLSPFAKLALPRNNAVKGCLFGKDKEVIMLLDHSELIADPDLVGTAEVCQEIQDVTETVDSEAETSGGGDHKTFILFSLDGCYAIDTEHVIEAIEQPETLLQPSFGLNFVEGVINLRGELITLFNLRKLYQMGTCDIEQQKVLIFKAAEQKYAILVDSVDEIAATTTDQILPNCEIEGSAIASPTCREVSGILNFGRRDDKKKYAMILDVAALLDRCDKTKT